MSDWSSDVCSSDLYARRPRRQDLRIVRRHRCRGHDGTRAFYVIRAVPDGNARAQAGQTTGDRRILNIGTADGVAQIQQNLGNAAHARAAYTHKMYALNRSEEHTSELQSLMRISYAVFCLKKKKQTKHKQSTKLLT